MLTVDANVEGSLAAAVSARAVAAADSQRLRSQTLESLPLRMPWALAWAAIWRQKC